MGVAPMTDTIAYFATVRVKWYKLALAGASCHSADSLVISAGCRQSFLPCSCRRTASAAVPARVAVRLQSSTRLAARKQPAAQLPACRLGAPQGGYRCSHAWLCCRGALCMYSWLSCAVRCSSGGATCCAGVPGLLPDVAGEWELRRSCACMPVIEHTLSPQMPISDALQT
jgi:hypothetical protein